MVNPRTVNVGIQVPLTGADVDTWGEDDINPNMVSLDGLLAGVQAIAVSGGPVTLTSPAGFTATPGAGPSQSENKVLRFTGALASDSTVTLPLPGGYIIENFTTGNFLLTLRGAVATTEVIAVQQGDTVNIYNDGSRVRFVGLARMGAMEFWSGLTAMPAWVAACTVPPYLLCDASVFNFSTYPYLGARYGSAFGGNGTTTAATPDMRGRMPLAYDGTGTRITVAGCGINGQTIGAGGGTQSVVLDTTMIPSHYHAAGIYDPGHTHTYSAWPGTTAVIGAANFAQPTGTYTGTTNNAATGVRVNSSNGLDTTYSSGGGLGHNNMVPTQVVGIWVVKT